MTFFSRGFSFRCMVFVILSSNGSSSSLISITLFFLDGNFWLFFRYCCFSLSISLFISELTLKSTFPSSTCCCCISSCVLLFLGLDSECTLVPPPNTFSSTALIIVCLLTSINSFLNTFSPVAFFILWPLTLTDSFHNVFSSVTFLIPCLLT